MPLICLGLSHHTAPVEIRERVAILPRNLGDTAKEIAALPGLQEAVVVSTCNRMEIYAGIDAASSKSPERHAQTTHRIKDWLRERFDLGAEIPKDAFFSHSGKAAARHLFSVASGLDSMVLGETEIFGQIKDAYHAALEVGATSRNFNKLFQEAFRVGKLVRNTTEIQRGATSVGSVAVELAEKLFGELSGCKVMLLGAGEISRRTAQSLQSRGASSIIVSNRNYDRAVELAAEMNGRALAFDHWPNEISTIDILITSTAAPHTVVHPGDLTLPLSQRRHGRPLFIIDIAVPRDVEPSVNDLENVYLFDIDALEQIAVEGRERRQKELARCHEIIHKHVEASPLFRPDVHHSSIYPNLDSATPDRSTTS